jgi:hypothetical protein
VAGDWRRLHNEELHNLYASPCRMTESRRMRWVRHVARMEEMKNAYNILVGRDHSENLDVNGMIILDFTFGK